MLSLMQVHCYAEEEYEFVSSIYGQYLTYTDNNNWYIKSPDGAVKVSGLYCEAISETRYLILGDNLKYGIADENGKILFGLFSQGSSDEDYLMYLSRFIITCFIAIMSLVILKFVLKLIKKDKALFFKTATVCVCVISIVYANFYIIYLIFYTSLINL